MEIGQTGPKQLISALADGDLRGDAFVRGVQAATDDGEGSRTWLVYQLAADMMREREAVQTGAYRPTASDEFLAHFRIRMQGEALHHDTFAATAVATMQAQRSGAGASPVVPLRQSGWRRIAANDPWRWSAACASVAAVAAIGWAVSQPGGGVDDGGHPAVQPQLAAVQQQSVPEVVPAGVVSAAAEVQREPSVASVPVFVVNGPSVSDGGLQIARPRMIRDPQLDELLAAHQHSRGEPAFQIPVGGVRETAEVSAP